MVLFLKLLLVSIIVVLDDFDDSLIYQTTLFTKLFAP